MIQRLRELRAPKGSPEAELAAAVAAMDPIAATAARQQRVLQAVAQRTRWRRSRFPALLRPALAGGILLGAGVGAAAATLGHDWVARQWRELTGPSHAVVAEPVATPHRTKPVARPVEVALAAPVEAAPAPEAPAPVRPPVARAAVHARAARGEDPTALVEAVRALRGDHDPRRAARLLDAYRRTYPRGALAEEALALEIEAAAALQSPRAVAFAQQYLHAYPGGRFCETARQALSARQ